MLARRAALAPLLALLACATVKPAAVVQIGDADPGAPIPGLDVCARQGTGRLRLDPARPLVVFVHGCRDSGGRFRELAQVFEAHGQQTACFNYDHRDRLDQSAAELDRALAALEARLPPGQITVLAHSQGGLVARRALTEERGAAVRRDGFTYRLFTVSSPFGGVRASADCGKPWLHVVTLGVTALVCQIAAGSNWTEIHPGSDFMRRPGTLLPEVQAVLKVQTDERTACLDRGEGGACRRRDFVFTLAEQQNPAVDADPRLTALQVEAGHVEIVGGDGVAPRKLIALLQERGILAQTPPERRAEIDALVARLFGE